jgi:hypothetical protein
MARRDGGGVTHTDRQEVPMTAPLLLLFHCGMRRTWCPDREQEEHE